MARVTIELEKVGTRWIGEVVGQRGGRRIFGKDAVDSLDAALAWARTSVSEVDPDEPAPMPTVAAPAPDEQPALRRKRSAA